MNWLTLIQQQSSLTASDYTHRPVLSALADMGIIQVNGHDACSFLHNLLTNDIAHIGLNQSQLNGLCTPKGRLLALCQVIRRQDDYILLLPHALCPSLLARLNLYKLRSNVTLTDISETHACLGLHTLSEKDPTPETTIHYRAHDHFLIIHKDEVSDVVHPLLDQDWVLCPQTVWEQREVEAGLPLIYPETQELFTPQQLNLDLTGGVSFNKGCYPGQEVVARLHYLGEPSRRMYHAQWQGTPPPQPGNSIHTQDNETAGHVVRSATTHPEQYHLLVSLKRAHLETKLYYHQTPLTLVDSQLAGSETA